MGKHIVAEADKTVSELVDLALSGEPVTITRDGKPIAELTPVPVEQQAGRGCVEESGETDYGRRRDPRGRAGSDP